MDYQFLKIQNEGAITILMISAPKSLNALNSTILKELGDFVANIDPATRVLIITGDGEKSFVAGADISEMANLNQGEGYKFGDLGEGVFRAIETLPIPVIAAVNGFALGGGCELAMACDILSSWTTLNYADFTKVIANLTESANTLEEDSA